MKLQVLKLATLLKRYSNTRVSVKLAKMFMNPFFEEHLRTTASKQM